MNEIAKTCENAYLNSKLNSKDENFSFAQVEKLPKVKGTFDKKFRELDLDELTSSLKAVLNCIDDNGCQTTSGGDFPYCVFFDSGYQFSAVFVNGQEPMQI